MERAKLFAYINNIQNHMEDDIKRILQDKQFYLRTAQIKAEGNNTKCVRKKRFNGSVTHGFGKRMCYVLPPLIVDKVRSYMQIISHDTLR